MAIPSPRPAAAGVGLLPIVGTGFYRSVKRGVRLAREVLICVACLAGHLALDEAVMPRASAVSGTPRLLDSVTGVFGILDRPFEPGDDRASGYRHCERSEAIHVAAK